MGDKNMTRKTEGSPATNIVKYLHDRKMTYKKIGNLMDFSESYINRVARGERTLSIEDLDRLAMQLGLALPELLLLATPINSVPPKIRSTHQALLRVLNQRPT